MTSRSSWAPTCSSVKVASWSAIRRPRKGACLPAPGRPAQPGWAARASAPAAAPPARSRFSMMRTGSGSVGRLTGCDDGIDHVHALDDAPEDHVGAVGLERGLSLLVEHDEELTALRIGCLGAGHGHDAASVATHDLFVGDGVARAAHAGALGVATLQHEIRVGTVEPHAVVVAGSARFRKFSAATGADSLKRPMTMSPSSVVRRTAVPSPLGASSASHPGWASHRAGRTAAPHPGQGKARRQSAQAARCRPRQPAETVGHGASWWDRCSRSVRSGPARSIGQPTFSGL